MTLRLGLCPPLEMEEGESKCQCVYTRVNLVEKQLEH